MIKSAAAQWGPSGVTYGIKGSALEEWDSSTSCLTLVPIKDGVGEIIVIIDKVVYSPDPGFVSPSPLIMHPRRRMCDERFR